MLCVLIRNDSKNTHHFQYKKENHLKLSLSYGNLFKGLKNEFKIAMVNEPSVFKPLKFYCSNHLYNNLDC